MDATDTRLDRRSAAEALSRGTTGLNDPLVPVPGPVLDFVLAFEEFLSADRIPKEWVAGLRDLAKIERQTRAVTGPLHPEILLAVTCCRDLLRRLSDESK